MTFRSARKVCSALLVLLVALVAGASAQDPRGTVAGTVTDVTGGVLPGVTIVVPQPRHRRRPGGDHGYRGAVPRVPA